MSVNSKIRLIPTVRGKIKLMVMVFDPSEASYWNILRQLDRQLSKWTDIMVFTRTEEDRDILKKGKWSRRIKIKENTLTGLSPWVRDSFFSFVSDNQLAKIIEFKRKPSEPNPELAETIAGNEVPVEEFDWFIAEGGNILIDENYVIIGWNDFQNMISYLHSKKECSALDDCFSDVRDKILSLLNHGGNQYKEVIVIGQPPLPGKERTQVTFAPHIDLFISLTGQKSPEGKPIIFIPFAVPDKPKSAAKSDLINSELNGVINQLKERFCIMRNPMPITAEGGKCYPCFYNNCLVEIYENSRKVWIPSFGTGSEKWKKDLKPFDELNRKLWENIGFEVFLIESDFHNLSKNGEGSLHCITNELIRI